MKDRVLGRLLASLCALAFFLVVGGTSVMAGEFEQLFAMLLNRPTDVELNLRYARLAIARGENRKALGAYERALAADPNNAEARTQLAALKVELEPTVTRIRLSLGAEYETNARQLPKGTSRPDDIHGDARVTLYDQRGMLGHVWRTRANARFDVFADISDLDYWRVRANTGPVFDLGDRLELHVAPGISTAFVDSKHLYYEPGLLLTLDNIMPGWLERIDVRAGYRDIDNSFANGNGYVLDVTVTHKQRGVLKRGDALYLYPKFAYRDASGNSAGGFGTPTSFFPPEYIEFGIRGYYFLPVTRHFVLGTHVFFHYRDYAQDVRFGTKDRHDYFLSPMGEFLFPDIFCRGCDVRAQYRFEKNFSNDATEKYNNHAVALKVVRRF